MAVEYDVLKEKIDENYEELKLIRKRTHTVENNISSTIGITREMQANINWIVKKLDEMIEIKERQNERIHALSEKVNKLCFDIIEIRNKTLEEKVVEKTNKLNKIVGILTSPKLWLFIGYFMLILMYWADNTSFATHVNNARRMISG
jgi:seryl-tRNA synthetase